MTKMTANAVFIRYKLKKLLKFNSIKTYGSSQSFLSSLKEFPQVIKSE